MPRAALSAEEFMVYALNTPGGFATPFMTKRAAVSLRNACSMVKSRDKRKKTEAAKENDPDFLIDYVPHSQYDGLHFSIEFRKGFYWLIGERAQDCPAPAMPLNELKAMEKGDAVENPSPAQAALQRLRERVNDEA